MKNLHLYLPVSFSWNTEFAFKGSDDLVVLVLWRFFLPPHHSVNDVQLKKTQRIQRTL